jgi:DNA topoisomerase IA
MSVKLHHLKCNRFSAGENDWSPDKKKLYDFIVRSFLATCSKPAVGRQTIVNIDIAGEAFNARGQCSISCDRVCTLVDCGGL